MPTYRTQELGYKLLYGRYCSGYYSKRKLLSADVKVSEQSGIAASNSWVDYEKHNISRTKLIIHLYKVIVRPHFE